MPKFKVTLREVVHHTFEVEADDEADARNAAEEQFVQGDNPINVSIESREALYVQAHAA